MSTSIIDFSDPRFRDPNPLVRAHVAKLQLQANANEFRAGSRGLVDHARRVHRDDKGDPIIAARHHARWARMLEDKEKYRWLVLVAPPGYAKALNVDTPVLTTDGWKNHGDLKEGDYVFAPSGDPVRVLGTRHWGYRPCHTVSFSNGEKIVADELHEWEVMCDREKYRTVGTRVGPRGAVKYVKGTRTNKRVLEILETRDLLRGQRRPPAIKIASPPILPERELPIDPYLLGVWLGDGSSGGGLITVGNQDIDHFESFGKVASMETVNVVRVEGLTKKLRLLGVKKDKHIPEEYLLASATQRLALLQGLMDTDGTVSPVGQCSFCTVKETLAQQVWSLVSSLGIKAAVCETPAKLYGKQCGTAYRVVFHTTGDWPCFRLERKTKRLAESVSPRTKTVYIKNVERTADSQTNCIMVEGGLYLAGKSLIPTHNSSWVTWMYPTWRIGTSNGSSRIGLISKTARQAESWVNAIGMSTESGWFQSLYPDCKPDKERGWSRQQLYYKGTPQGSNPSVLGSGIGGPIQGKRFDEIIVDDPVNWDDARSDAIMEGIRHWFKGLLLQRFPPGMGPPDGDGRMVVVLTRWGMKDLVPMLQDDLGFHVETMPALGYWDREMNEDGSFEYGTEPLWPQKESASQLLAEREKDQIIFELVKQGNPLALAADMFDPTWFERGRPPARHQFDQVYQYVDTAGGKDRRRGDFFALATVGIRNGGREVWILGMERHKLPAPDQERSVMKQYEIWKPDLIIIEDVNEGTALYQRMVTTTRLPLKAQRPEKDKEFRAIPLSNAYRQHMVWHPEGEKWVGPYESELTSFPAGVHDDQVDAACGAFNAHDDPGPRARAL